MDQKIYLEFILKYLDPFNYRISISFPQLTSITKWCLWGEGGRLIIIYGIIPIASITR